MLAARGVSLGLGKINLSELNQLPVADRALLGRLKKKATEQKPKLRIKKHVDKKTLWAACRAVVIGGCIIAAGLFMTVLGYFDRDLTTTSVFNSTTGEEVLIVDASLRYKLTSFRYIGPVLMGIGTFLLIIACVIALESRDRHAQIIQEESTEYRKTKRELITSATKSSLLAEEAERPKELIVSVIGSGGAARSNGHMAARQTDRRKDSTDDLEETEASSADELALEETRLFRPSYDSNNRQNIVVEIHTPTTEADALLGPSTSTANGRRQEGPLLLSTINLRRPKGQAPIAAMEELPLSASCSTINTTSDRFER
ncbi:hypothetical protein M3Y99_00347000 [Aphelenchoides fujianensis]|nr:hypothetical protein M3Y99_00347000 [Aphelenchoides fujianensis]